jgi:anti-anti-sigma factor
MLRISPAETTDDDGGVRLRLEGEVSGPWVHELRRVCSETLDRNGHGAAPLVLDLADVHFIDPAGIGLFRELVTRRVWLTNCSVFVAEQLKEVGNDDR